MEMIQVRNLSKSYGKIKALRRVSFSVDEGDIVGYIGPNGSGKTTTIKMITGLCKQDEGSVTVLDQSVPEDYVKLANKVAVIFEEPSDYDYLTVWENLEFYTRLVNMPSCLRRSRIQQSLENMGMVDRKDTLARALSKGTKRKLAVARALVTEPQILVLDEPFDGIDVSSRMRIVAHLKEWVKEGEHSLLITSHNMYEVEELCTKIIILNQGEVVAAGSLDELRHDSMQFNIEITFNADSGQVKIEDILNSYEEELLYKVDGNKVLLRMESSKIPCLCSYLYNCGIGFDEIRKRHEHLNDIYMRIVGDHE